ncbi:MAG: heavy metal-associated domain-containing protein [Nitriliruptoraceae bacterium]
MTQTYTVPDVTCNHCKASIESALHGVAGVTAAEVDVAAQTVSVTGDVAPETVLQTIRDAGYTPTT